MKSLHYIKAISAESSNKIKLQILEEALQRPDSEILPLLFDIAMSYKINTYITNFPIYRAPRMVETDMSEIIPLIKSINFDLSTGKRHTKDEWISIHNTIQSWTSEEDGKIIESVLTKDLTIGVAVKSYNKVASKLKLYQIPFYDTMRVSPINDNSIDYSKGAFVGLKKDGVNATVERGANIRSRNGQVICLTHIEEILSEVSKKYVIFGELVSTTRQSSSGLVNSAMKSMYDTKLPVHELAIHIFDAMSIEEYESKKFITPFKDRIKLAEGIVSELNHPMVFFVEQTVVYSKDEAMTLFDKAIELGEEGIVVNDADAPFEIKRTKYRARCKNDLTVEVRIIGTTPHNKQPEWVGSLTVISNDGVMVDVGSGLTENMMIEFYKNPPLNKIITVCYNSVIPNSSGDGWTLFLPTIGKDKSIRFDKDTIDNLIPKVKI